MFLQAFLPSIRGEDPPLYEACSQVFLGTVTDGRIPVFSDVPGVPGEHQKARFSSRRWEHHGNTCGNTKIQRLL